MKVLYGEGLATRTGSKSCPVVRKDAGEALTGETRRLGIEPRKNPTFRVPTLWIGWKATSDGSQSQDSFGPCVVGDPKHARKHFARESGYPVVNHVVVRAVNPTGVIQQCTAMGSLTVS